MPYADAVEIFRLADFDWPLGSPSQRLIDTYRNPVEEVFDQREADAGLAEARTKLFEVPNPLAAVTAAIDHEVPDLGPHEAAFRTARLVDAELDARRDRHQQRLDAAQAAVDAVAQRRTRRLSTKGT